MGQSFDFLIFIGRFQPFHHGHEFVVREALKHAKTLILLIGSANSARTIKNPFTFDEREMMILGGFEDVADRIICLPIDDTLYNDHKWLQNIQSAVSLIVSDTDKVGIIGHTKDDSSYYLTLFPHWECLELPNFEQLSATPLRKAYLLGDESWQDKMPQASQDFLIQFKATYAYADLQQEYQHILEYQKAWQHAPYPPVFVTTDVLVVQAGHVLLIERGGDYGRGLWAMPGGFLDKGESLHHCALRELKEETNLVIDKGAPYTVHTFDAPDRSLRGRTVTHVHYFELMGNRLPDVVAADDANHAFWLPLGNLDGTKMFEDHYSIVAKILGL